MYKITLTLALIALMLMGCASGVPPMPAVSKRYPPANLITPCPPELPQPATGKGPDLLANHVETAKLYHECRVRLEGLAGWVANDGTQ